ncbi:alpha/beta fold hydrolase [Gandjariella thermophila]|uniref:Alpha/beta hydrolase n=1 Tax=Gandjariella thermophila TaxID=1931992 RepID=A0A4D4J752_9PSEU|nr:alpha/beta hydrolase [Gandjariella thermophila]GDY30840.1 alpha/beta hydrolase [Gandjariella thermophila]
MAISESLGAQQEIDLPRGRLRYRDRGEGPPVVFVHGLMANADLWRNVVPRVAEAGYRCIAPDWPLGAHELPVPGADLSPPGVADLIADLLNALDLRGVTLVANDTGGALTQIVLARRPERLARVVLTSCDSFEYFFPPPVLRYLPPLAALPGSAWLLVQALRSRWVQRLPIAYGWLTMRPLPPEILDSFVLPSRRSAAVRDDLRRFVRAVHRRYTLAAAEALPAFRRPVLLAWATEDRLFPVSLAHRLAERLPAARTALVPGSRTFVPEDQPERLAELVVDFAREGTRAGH